MSTSYTVTADFLYVDGKPKPYVRGDTVSNLSKDDAERHKAAGNIASSGGDAAKEAKASAPVDEGETVPDDHGSTSALVAEANSVEATDDDDVETVPETHHGDGDPASAIVAAANSAPASPGRVPAKAAGVAVWREYAVSGAPEGQRISREEADALSKEDLRDRFGGE